MQSLSKLTRWRFLLTSQSLALLALLLLIKIICSVLYENSIAPLLNVDWCLVIRSHICLVLLALCLLGIFVAGICGMVCLRSDLKHDSNPVTIEVLEVDKGYALSFFATVVLPLISGDPIKEINAFLLLAIIIIMFWIIKNEELFYANPIMSIIGYRCIKYQKWSEEAYGKSVGYCEGKVGLTRRDIKNKMKCEEHDMGGFSILR